MTSRVQDVKPTWLSAGESKITAPREAVQAPRFLNDEPWYAPAERSQSAARRASPPSSRHGHTRFASSTSISSIEPQSPSIEDSGYASSRHSRSTISDRKSSLRAGNRFRPKGGSPWQDLFEQEEDNEVGAYTYRPKQLEYNHFGEIFSTPTEYPQSLQHSSDAGDRCSNAADGISTPKEAHIPPSCSDSASSRSTVTARRLALKDSVRGAFRRPLSMLRRVSQLAVGRSQKGEVCPWCPPERRIPTKDLEAHVKMHLEDLKYEHTCESCKVAFMHAKDLRYHQIDQGHHATSFPCDRGSKSTKILTWELAQLRRFRSFCDDVKKVSMDPVRWTLDSSDRSIRESNIGAWDSLPRLTSSYSAPSTIEHGTRLMPKTDHEPSSLNSGDKSEPCNFGDVSQADVDTGEYSSDGDYLQEVHKESNCIGLPANCTQYLSPPASPIPDDNSLLSDLTRHHAQSLWSTYLDSPPPTLHETSFDVEKMHQPHLTTGFEHSFQRPAPQTVTVPGHCDTAIVQDNTTQNAVLSFIFPLSKGIANSLAFTCVLTPPQSPPRIPQQPSLSSLSQVMNSYDTGGCTELHEMPSQLASEGSWPQSLRKNRYTELPYNNWPCKKRRLSAHPDEVDQSCILAPCHDQMQSALDTPAVPRNWTGPFENEMQDFNSQQHTLLPSPEIHEALQLDQHCIDSSPHLLEILSSPLGTTSEQPMPHKLDMWFSDQEAHGPRAGGSDIAEGQAETPSSAPGFSYSEFSTTPSRPLAERVNDFFNKFDEEICQATPFTVDFDNCHQDELSLERLFSSLQMQGPVTLDMVLDLIHRSASFSGVDIDIEDLRSWSHDSASLDDTGLDLRRFKNRLQDAYDGIREVNDTILDFGDFVANIGHATKTGHRNDTACGGQANTLALQRIASLANSDQPMSSQSTTGTVGQASQSAENGSNGKGKQNSNKRELPDSNSEDAGPSKKMMVATDDGDEASTRAKLQLPCPLRTCCGKDIYISDVLSKLDVHASQHHRYAAFICGDCYATFKLKDARSAHSKDQLCEKFCVFPDCPLNTSSGNNVQSVLALRHKSGPRCPSAKGRSKDRWRYIFALCMSSCPAEDNRAIEVLDPEISHGVREEHVAQGTSATKQFRPPSQKLLDCQKLLRETTAENKLLQRERVQIAVEKAQIAGERDMLRRHNVELSRWLQLCMAQFNIPPDVKDLLNGVLRDANQASGFKPQACEKEQQSQNQYVPHTPSSSRVGDAATRSSVQQYETPLLSSTIHNQMNPATALASPSTMGGYSADGFNALVGNNSLPFDENNQFNQYMPIDSNGYMNWPQNGP